MLQFVMNIAVSGRDKNNWKEMITMPDNFDIIPNNGHFDVYINGKLYCTADTVPEAAKEIEEWSEHHA